MNRSNENWQSEQFEIKDFQNQRKIIRNNKSILKELGLPFVTYNANQELPCYTYDIAHRTCINQHGYMTREYLQSPVCRKAGDWLQQCVKLNQTIYEIHKYHSEMMLNEEDSSPVYSAEDVI